MSKDDSDAQVGKKTRPKTPDLELNRPASIEEDFSEAGSKVSNSESVALSKSEEIKIIK